MSVDDLTGFEADAQDAAVLERLKTLVDERGLQSAEQVAEYVARGRPLSATITPAALVTVLRADEDLALELTDSFGRSIIAAGTDATGETRYAVWEHSTLAAKAGRGPVRTRSWQYRADTVELLTDRRPRVRERLATPLADLDVPERFGANTRSARRPSDEHYRCRPLGDRARIDGVVDHRGPSRLPMDRDR